MVIDANTKIGALLKQHPQALEAIVGINPAFEKLRNPILRRLMANRTSIAMAAKIGGCRIADFYQKLQPLGFKIREEETEAEQKKQLPLFMQRLQKSQVVALDVRNQIASGNDPLQLILQHIQTLQPSQVLKIINTFEPVPLMKLLAKKGFESYADEVAPQLIETYFYQKEKETFSETPTDNNKDWDTVYQQHQNKLQTIDVRHLPMPQPMHAILEKLEQLPSDFALLVHHKRIPVFLLPELSQRGFDWRTRTLSNDEIELLIFRK